MTTSIDRAAATNPNPGRATLHRLNRTEYANAVHDLLGLDVDPAPLLPADDESYGFDDIADVLRTSPSLLERYMSASWNLSRLAVGDPAIVADTPPIAPSPIFRRTAIWKDFRSEHAADWPFITISRWMAST